MRIQETEILKVSFPGKLWINSWVVKFYLKTDGFSSSDIDWHHITKVNVRPGTWKGLTDWQWIGLLPLFVHTLSKPNSYESKNQEQKLSLWIYL